MRKLILGLIVLIPILMSCGEEEDKDITTDVAIEATQLFNISKVWNESLYFAMISWEEYLLQDSLKLPSCPQISIDENTKEVTLNFLASTTCVQTGEYGRSGKLILSYNQAADSVSSVWTMEYDDYFFGTNSIKGIRTFSSDDSLQVSEDFSEITEKTEKDLSTIFNGKFVHIKNYEGDSLTTLVSLGRIEGKNAAGRDFEIIMDSPVKHDISCYQQNLILPNSAKESWAVSRSGTSEATYILTYESQPGECIVYANAILPDGRRLLLNPNGD
ncbi:hypothetical protein [uncultured Algoriphagus sp.]|uniref:hypothetical protein n=1 Tax=uncultured Algoriphagus sp. TaxID=417365 RepID=UPI0030EF0DE4|tara:strand:- start:55595 stop:56413 length:819 start_codon:yes stop_codon:yes gene_type:complete